MPWQTLSRLWLHEPDTGTLETVREIESLAPHVGEAAALSAAYSELFLLNVYPYGTVFTDPSGELNASSAGQMARRYEAHGYSPPELSEVGAPDHAGLCLGFVGHLAAKREKDPEFSSLLLDWLPICCLAVEREPAAHPFYKALAALTRAMLLEEASACTGPPPELPEEDEPEGEVRLADIVRYLLAPARSGLFLSRSRLGWIARSVGLGLPFGTRFDVAEALFSSAGESGHAPEVLASLQEEAAVWEDAYQTYSAAQSAWTPFASRWRGRIGRTQCRLAGMLEMIKNPTEFESAAEST